MCTLISLSLICLRALTQGQEWHRDKKSTNSYFSNPKDTQVFFKRSQPIRKSFEWNPNLCFHCIILSVVMQRDNTQNVRLLLTQKIRDEGDCEMRIQKDFNKTYFKEFWIRFENSRMPRLDSNFWGAQSREAYFVYSPIKNVFLKLNLYLACFAPGRTARHSIFC